MAYEGALQKATYEAGFVPVDMSAGANAGDWVSMENYRRLEIILFKGAGTAGDDPTITVQQATASDGTGAKALNFTVVYEKVGTLNAVTAWTRQTQSAGNTYQNTASAESQAIIVVEIDAAMLDADNGFTFVQASVADVGTNAQVGAILYRLSEPRYPQGAAVSALS